MYWIILIGLFGVCVTWAALAHDEDMPIENFDIEMQASQRRAESGRSRQRE